MRGESVSTVVADLAIRGLAQLDEPVRLHIDDRTGLPTLSIGRKITASDVADALDEG